MTNEIRFNRPYTTGIELSYIQEAIANSSLSGNGIFTKKCHAFFEQRYKFQKTFLTTSCTDALEMCAILADIKPGDEVIIPSYTFVSTALAFIRQGATIVFADSKPDHPNIDEDQIESLITSKTKAIVPVHYAGVSCNMDKIMSIAKKYNLIVIEDAAQSIDSFYNGKPLGGIGHMAAFSFHETKNIQSGEGGLLVINDKEFEKRAEIIWEKGTNRAKFFRGEVDKYGWVDTGSSFLPSEITAAFLYAQLVDLENIQSQRIQIWNQYYSTLAGKVNGSIIQLPVVPDYASNNGHMFYIICKNLEVRTRLITRLKDLKINPVFHYLSLHKSDYYKSKYTGSELPNSDKFTDCLLRLPFYIGLSQDDIAKITNAIIDFSNNE